MLLLITMLPKFFLASTALVFLTILGNSLTIARSDTLDGDRVNNHKIIEVPTIIQHKY
jgi:hypothetical protein